MHAFSVNKSSDLVTPWTAALQAPLSMALSKQEYWSGLPPPGDLPNQWIKPESPALAGGFFTNRAVLIIFIMLYMASLVLIIL